MRISDWEFRRVLFRSAQLAKLREDIELIQVGYPEFDTEAYRQGHMTPVYFGTALKNFGVDELLTGLGNFATPPRPQQAEGRMVLPTETTFTGFEFTVQEIGVASGRTTVCQYVSTSVVAVSLQTKDIRYILKGLL